MKTRAVGTLAVTSRVERREVATGRRDGDNNDNNDIMNIDGDGMLGNRMDGGGTLPIGLKAVACPKLKALPALRRRARGGSLAPPPPSFLSQLLPVRPETFVGFLAQEGGYNKHPLGRCRRISRRPFPFERLHTERGREWSHPSSLIAQSTHTTKCFREACVCASWRPCPSDL